MQTLDAPIYEVKQDSEWYKAEVQCKSDRQNFYSALKDKFGTIEGFAYYHSEYFGVAAGSEAYELFKDEVSKNPKRHGFHPFKKRSKYYKEIKEMIEAIAEVSPFKAHDVFGLNNINARQWIDGRLFYGVRQDEDITSEEVTPVAFKDYLQVVMSKLD